MADAENPKTSDDVLAQKQAMCAVDHPPETDRNPCKFPDLLFAIAWLFSVVTMVVLAFVYGWTELGTVDYNNSGEKKRSVRRVMTIFIVAFLFALILAQLVMHVMMRFGGMMIHASLFTVEALLLVAGFVAINRARWYVAFFLLFWGFLAVCFHCFCRNRIEFAAATLHVGCEIVLAYKVLQLVAFIGCVVAVGFFFIFALAIYGFYNFQKHKHKSDNQIAFVLFLLILIFFWTQQVFRYITIATTGGTAQAWWYGRLPTSGRHPAVDSLARNCTYNLGAICFGSAFVAVIETLVVVVQWIKQKAKDYPGGCCINCCLSCVQCCLGCCESIMDYFNTFCFVYVGIHGYSYLYAGKQVVNLFSTHGLTAIGNDYFVNIIFFWNSLAIGLVTALFGVGLVQYGPDDWHKGTAAAEVIVGLFCGFGGLLIASIVFSLIDGANKATLVLFAENPHVLEHMHIDDYNRLSKVWTLLGKDVKDEEEKK